MARRARHESPSQRQLRVAEQIRHILAEALTRGELHDPRLVDVNVTIGEVRVSPDLRQATVFAAELGKRLSPSTLEALEDAAARLGGQVGRRMHLKYAPRLRFVEDTLFDDAAKMDRLIDEAIKTLPKQGAVGSTGGGDSDGA